MAKNIQRKKQFAGRDKSWMNFNRRVLEEAEDGSNPILERVKFLAITGSNLDEYVEIRLAGLLQRTEDGHTEPGYDGLPPQESLDILTQEMHDFVAAQYRCWKEQLLPELRQHGIRLLPWEELSEVQRKVALSYFQREVDPLLTPITIDPAHPFPRVLNRALCLAILLRPKRRSSSPQVLGVVTVPRALARFVRLPAADGNFDYMLLQDLIAQNLEELRPQRVLRFHRGQRFNQRDHRPAVAASPFERSVLFFTDKITVKPKAVRILLEGRLMNDLFGGVVNEFRLMTINSVLDEKNAAHIKVIRPHCPSGPLGAPQCPVRQAVLFVDHPISYPLDRCPIIVPALQKHRAKIAKL